MSEKQAKRERRAARAVEQARSQVCRLCLREDRPPIDSHILPNSFWHFVRENGQYSAFKQMGKPVELREQSGHPEPLMCRECDSSFSGVEAYSRDRLAKWVGYNEQVDTKNYSVPPFIQVDYFKIKLFYLLSVWRAAMASGPMFQAVSLPEDITEALRKRLLVRDVGPPNFCPFGLEVESWGRGMRVFYPPESTYLRRAGYPKGIHFFVWSGFGASVAGFVAEAPLPASEYEVQMLDESGRLPVYTIDSSESDATRNLRQVILATRSDSD